MITAKTELRKVLHSLQRYFFREQYIRKNVKNFILKIDVDRICGRSARVCRKTQTVSLVHAGEQIDI